MTGRERVIAAIERKPLDRIPRYDGFWEDTLQRWESEGLQLPEVKKITVDGEEKIPVAMEGGGYIYHSDHSIPPEVSLETYLHAMKILDEIGTYQ